MLRSSIRPAGFVSRTFLKNHLGIKRYNATGINEAKIIERIWLIVPCPDIRKKVVPVKNIKAEKAMIAALFSFSDEKTRTAKSIKKKSVALRNMAMILNVRKSTMYDFCCERNTLQSVLSKFSDVVYLDLNMIKFL